MNLRTICLSLFTITLPWLLVACGSNSNSGDDDQPAPSSISSSSVAPVSDTIKVNQLGFLPAAHKLAVVPPVSADSFALIDASTGNEVFTGNLGGAATWAPAGDSVRLADFSSFATPGEYRVRVAGIADSNRFRIAQDIYQPLNGAAIKAFYFNRASTALLESHAGVYARAAGHLDTNVQVHASAASPERPEGTVIQAPKGWYDAGDYNKYIVNSGISTYSLLAAYEHFPDHYQGKNLNIPESDNTLPDLLDEIQWNLEWMLDMQDPNDGGVYHKLTDKEFDGAVMPHETGTQRYVVQKGTSATLNFAAVMAVASRVYEPFNAELSAEMLAAAESAWEWAQANPEITYTQPADIKTGAYGDATLTDEHAWAAAELYITTGNAAYYNSMNPTQTQATVPSWGDVRGLAWVSLAHHRSNLTDVADKALIAQRITALADTLVEDWKASAYAVPMRQQNFVWGSNSVALNQAMMLLQGFQLNGNRDYLNAAQSLLDYILGRNPTDFSFVTGYGVKTPQHIHHRPSEADGIAAPIPGFLAGGPHAGQQDASDCPVSYPSDLPAKSYLDHWCSYASNEIAINWNAPLVYVSGALQVLTEQ